MSPLDPHGIFLVIIRVQQWKVKPRLITFRAESNQIHLLHVETNEKLEVQTGAFRGIVAVPNPVELPVL